MDEDSAARRARANQRRGVLYPSLLPGGQDAHSSPAMRRGALNPTPLRNRPVESPEDGQEFRPRTTATSGSYGTGSHQHLQRIAELERMLERERTRREEAEFIIARVESACSETVADLNAKLRELTSENRSLRQAMAESRLQREVDGVRVAVAAESTERRRELERVDRALAEHDGILRHVMGLLSALPGTASSPSSGRDRASTVLDVEALARNVSQPTAQTGGEGRRSQSFWTARSSTGSAAGAREPETTTAASRRARRQRAAAGAEAYHLSQPVSPGSPLLEHTQASASDNPQHAGAGESSAAAVELSDSLQLDDGDDGGASSTPTHSDDDPEQDE